MTIRINTMIHAAAVLGVLLLNAPFAVADEKSDLTQLLHEFLAGVAERATHDRFWADDLVYTSSSGTRTNKAEIMSGFDGTDTEGSDEEAPAYSAEDVQINVYGSTAVVAFRLVAKTAGSADQEYLNTGTFLKHNGTWQAVAWQATKIPVD
jgi:hypothetical protein